MAWWIAIPLCAALWFALSLGTAMVLGNLLRTPEDDDERRPEVSKKMF